jgi:hypothetical protein
MTKQQPKKKQDIQIQTFAIFQECAMKINNHGRNDIGKKNVCATFLTRFHDSLKFFVIT